jgi:hypothetical protein
MMVRASACPLESQTRAGPQRRRGGTLLPLLVMIASAVCAAIASFHLIGIFQAKGAPHVDRANGGEGLPITSGNRCMEQVAKHH